jgi:hypothetical protein
MLNAAAVAVVGPVDRRHRHRDSVLLAMCRNPAALHAAVSFL